MNSDSLREKLENELDIFIDGDIYYQVPSTTLDALESICRDYAAEELEKLRADIDCSPSRYANTEVAEYIRGLIYGHTSRLNRDRIKLKEN